MWAKLGKALTTPLKSPNHEGCGENRARNESSRIKDVVVVGVVGGGGGNY